MGADLSNSKIQSEKNLLWSKNNQNSVISVVNNPSFTIGMLLSSADTKVVNKNDPLQTVPISPLGYLHHTVVDEGNGRTDLDVHLRVRSVKCMLAEEESKSASIRSTKANPYEQYWLTSQRRACANCNDLLEKIKRNDANQAKSITLKQEKAVETAAADRDSQIYQLKQSVKMSQQGKRRLEQHNEVLMAENIEVQACYDRLEKENIDETTFQNTFEHFLQTSIERCEKYHRSLHMPEEQIQAVSLLLKLQLEMQERGANKHGGTRGKKTGMEVPRVLVAHMLRFAKSLGQQEYEKWCSVHREYLSWSALMQRFSTFVTPPGVQLHNIQIFRLTCESIVDDTGHSIFPRKMDGTPEIIVVGSHDEMATVDGVTYKNKKATGFSHTDKSVTRSVLEDNFSRADLKSDVTHDTAELQWKVKKTLERNKVHGLFEMWIETVTPLYRASCVVYSAPFSSTTAVSIIGVLNEVDEALYASRICLLKSTGDGACQIWSAAEKMCVSTTPIFTAPFTTRIGRPHLYYPKLFTLYDRDAGHLVKNIVACTEANSGHQISVKIDGTWYVFLFI